MERHDNALVCDRLFGYLVELGLNEKESRSLTRNIEQKLKKDKVILLEVSPQDICDWITERYLQEEGGEEKLLEKYPNYGIVIQDGVVAKIDNELIEYLADRLPQSHHQVDEILSDKLFGL